MPTQDVTLRVLTREHPINPESREIVAMRYRNNKSVPSRFITSNMQAFRVLPSDPLMTLNTDGSDQHFRRGLFVVMEKVLVDDTYLSGIIRENELGFANAKQKLFFVFPQMITKDEHSIVAAQHFTFVRNSQDRVRPIHFHLTMYAPISSTTGACAHIKNYLPDTWPVPNNALELLHLNLIRENVAIQDMKNEIHRILRRHLFHNNHGGGASAAVVASVGRSRKTTAMHRKTSGTVSSQYDGLPSAITEIRIFTIRNPPPHEDSATATVILLDNRPIQVSLAMRNAFSFQMMQKDTMDDDLVRGIALGIVRRMYTNDSFVDEDDDDDENYEFLYY